MSEISSDVAKSWVLSHDGSYSRVPVEGPGATRSQQRFIEAARERAKKADPLSRAPTFRILDVAKGEEQRKLRRAKERKKKDGRQP